MINNNGIETLYYGYTDNLGSLIALTDINGNVVEKYAYDPWGARRNPNDWTQAATPPSGGWGVITNRGYTGHEHLDLFAIINMNGRVYDPLTAMFFSPDPFISSPGDWLGYNRYSYVMNNPFRYTDPSGYRPAPTEFDKQGFGGGGGYMYFPGELGDNKGYVGGFGNGANAINPYNLNSWWNGYQGALSAGYLGGLNNFLDSYFNNVNKSNFNGSFNFGFEIGRYYDRSNAGGGLGGYQLPEIVTIWKTVTINLNEKRNNYTYKRNDFSDFTLKYTLQEGYGLNGSAFYRGYVESKPLNGKWYIEGYAEIIPVNPSTTPVFWGNLKVYQNGDLVGYSFFSMNNETEDHFYDAEWTKIGYGLAWLPTSGNVQVQLNIGASTYEFFKGSTNQIIYSNTYKYP